ncbi:hypothetical protein [Flavobacterium magnum]|uniref:hypothetical protein n=1 Tax=Flavobacterium magnum TaxID=2162713 RepID=UPI0011B2105B|nr:hypothetical protein [Flavobacterium magnum]
MNFKITNSDRTKYLRPHYYDWPEKISNKNSRRFKKEFDYNEYEKIQCLWEISNYLGPAPPRSMTFFSFYSTKKNDFVTSKVSISSVREHLKSNPMIDETYLPIEGDPITYI